MPAANKTSRTQLWMDTLGEWSWPGRAAEAVEALPPSWVPAFPPRLEPLAAGAPAQGAWERPHSNARITLVGALLSALAALCVTFALSGPQPLEQTLGIGDSQSSAGSSATSAKAPAPQPLPTLVASSHDAAGSSIDAAHYSSAALAGGGSFHVYLPPGYATTNARYPVIYLLHGNSQPATAFLQIGLQEQLDRLIARHEIPPLIAVMIQGGPGDNNWRDQGTHRYESYVVEVQELIDHMLPTLAGRGTRAVIGDSMGGYGAVNVVLGHPQRFSVVESWLGFFNGLDDELAAARPVIAREGLHAYLYGGESDTIADPSENAPFAAQLHAAGASAHGTIYAGGHTMETLQAHLGHMLRYAGSALAAGASAQAATPKHITSAAATTAVAGTAG